MTTDDPKFHPDVTKVAEFDADREPLDTVWLWLAQPEVGKEHLLMVLTDDPTHGQTYRPLIALDLDVATGLRDLAADAASSLGVTAVLREFKVERFAGSPVHIDKVDPS